MTEQNIRFSPRFGELDDAKAASSSQSLQKGGNIKER
jgi:hypothetical protein